MSKNSIRSKEYYHKNHQRVRGYTNRYRKLHSEKMSIKIREWQKNNPEKLKQYSRKWKFNLTEIQYQEIFLSQNGKCPICQVVLDSKFKNTTPHIDHDRSCCSGSRSCGKCIRGLLCSRCNRGIGLFEDNQDYLRGAARYLIAKS